MYRLEFYRLGINWEDRSQRRLKKINIKTQKNK